MNFLRTIFSILIFPALFLVTEVETVLAQTPTVTFEQTPLFLNANIVPGDSEARTVTVTNGGTESEDVYVSVANVFSTGLAEVMSIEVTSPANTHFSGVFEDFFAATPIALGTLTPGTTRVYTFNASLPAPAGNEYQEKQLGFDLIIGFVGGGQVVDNPGGGNGGGGGGSTQLTIFNEEVESVSGNGATLTWNTNLNASTYLVCGLLGNEPFVLTATPPLFGYDFVLPETVSITKVHSAYLTGLDIGTYECRPAGRVNPTKPFTVGQALEFTIGPDGVVAGVQTSAPLPIARPFTPTGSVLGASGKGSFGAPTYDEWKAELEAEREAKRLAELEAASSTVTQGGSSTSNGGETSDIEVESDSSLSWFWALVVLFVLSVVWYWKRGSRI